MLQIEVILKVMTEFDSPPGVSELYQIPFGGSIEGIVNRAIRDSLNEARKHLDEDQVWVLDLVSGSTGQAPMTPAEIAASNGHTHDDVILILHSTRERIVPLGINKHIPPPIAQRLDTALQDAIAGKRAELYLRPDVDVSIEPSVFIEPNQLDETELEIMTQATEEIQVHLHGATSWPVFSKRFANMVEVEKAYKKGEPIELGQMPREFWWIDTLGGSITRWGEEALGDEF